MQKLKLQDETNSLKELLVVFFINTVAFIVAFIAVAIPVFISNDSRALYLSLTLSLFFPYSRLSTKKSSFYLFLCFFWVLVGAVLVISSGIPSMLIFGFYIFSFVFFIFSYFIFNTKEG